MLCSCGHTKHVGRCQKPTGPGNGKARVPCGCPVFRRALPNRQLRNGWGGQPPGATWTTKRLRVRNRAWLRAKRTRERENHGVKMRKGPPTLLENAIERMQRRLRGEGY